MGLTVPTDKQLCSSHQAILNGTAQLEPENIHCLREAGNLLPRKKVIKGNIILKLRKKIMQPARTSYSQKVCSKHAMSTTGFASSYSYQQDCNYPITMNDWNPLHAPVLTVRSVPVIIPASSPIFTTQITPLVGTMVQPILSPLIPQSYLPEDVANISGYVNEYSYFADYAEVSNEIPYYIDEVTSTGTTTITELDNTSTEAQIDQDGLIESYLKLPKELFPSANMLALDPNPLIDEFCKIPNLLRHMPWILDLEFGIPKSPITRPIPTYDVKFNSIHCKNAPDAIHPGFESCDPDFKKVLLFYYDCIVSAWYRGYMIMHCDRSVENFQSWLLIPMQVLGMCWP